MKSALLLSLLPLSIGTGLADNTAPNVIYLMVDDLGIGDVGCYGQKIIQTPNIDQLAAKGVRFTHHYSGSTVSAPSRCCVMSGKDTGHAAIRGNKPVEVNKLPYDLDLPKEEITVADLFKQKNYRTACIGKWGMGTPQGEGHPNNHGFDYFYGYLSQVNAHYYYPTHLFENKNMVQLDKKQYSHALIMEKAFQFITDCADKPFFLYLTPTIPHAEMVLPQEDLAPFLGKFGEEKPYPDGYYGGQDAPKAAFAAMVTRLDRDLGRLMELLEKQGILENTLIVFTSDNGAHREGGHQPQYFDSNGPYRGYKRDLYEGGLRTPFIVHWPAQIKAGRVCDHPSAFWDFMPTAAELIGVETPSSSQGISYLPSLTEATEQQKHDALYFEFHEDNGKQALIQGDWKLIHLQINNKDKETYELYNIKEDIGEEQNLAAQHPERVEAMKKIMTTSRTPNSNFQFH